jgi:ubiquinone/menaquinone biosynthesis C-methylase UbiE
MQKEDPLISFPDEGVSEEIVIFCDDAVLRDVPRGSKVLDIGCGVGRFTRKVAERAREVVGIDLSESDIERARTLTTNRNVRFEVMNGESLTFPSETFDVVVARWVYHHLRQKLVHKQIARVLKKGGRLVVVDIVSEFFAPHNKALIFLTALVRNGLVETAKTLRRMAYIFRKERRAHIAEDVKRLSRSHTATIKDARRTYQAFYPGARVRRMMCATYVLWTKPG